MFRRVRELSLFLPVPRRLFAEIIDALRSAARLAGVKVPYRLAIIVASN